MEEGRKEKEEKTKEENEKPISHFLTLCFSLSLAILIGIILI
jgi:hypothetical protein